MSRPFNQNKLSRRQQAVIFWLALSTPRPPIKGPEVWALIARGYVAQERCPESGRMRFVLTEKGRAYARLARPT